MNKRIAKVTSLYDRFVRQAILRLQHPLLLVFRLYFGYQFFLSGKGKLEHIERTTAFFASLNIPAPALNAWFVGGLECVGGILLVVGLFSRLISLPLAINMSVAYLTADSDALKSLFTDPSAFLGAEPFMYLLTAVLIFVFGSGVFSVDALLWKTMGTKGDGDSA